MNIEYIPDISSSVKDLLNGCIIKSQSGVKMYTPDGKANYAALWTRDFSYMVEDAGELIPLEDIKNGIEYLMNGIREDGWIPDRVDDMGKVFYTAGNSNFPASPNLDNGCFLCFLADNYLSMLEKDDAESQFSQWRSILCGGIDCIPVSEDGIVCNRSNPPHSPYGFTDTVCKTGLLCMETLLLWRAKKKMIKWLKNCGLDADEYEKDCDSIERSFEKTFMQADGTFKAATETCAQTDVWAMCYAVSIGFPFSESVKAEIADWIIKHYDSITQSGQLRHLPMGEYWEKTFVNVLQGTYQNGAFWATPIKWLFDVLQIRDPRLARKTVEDAINYCEKYGFFECINGEYRQLDTYVASATALYGACKKL